MKKTLLTLALTAALIPATFAQTSSTTSSQSSHSSSSQTTTTDPVTTPDVAASKSSHHDSTTVTETKEKYGKHHAKVSSKTRTSRSNSSDRTKMNGDVNSTTVSRDSAHSSSTSTTTPPQE